MKTATDVFLILGIATLVFT